mmetsp:Transcript_3299/g.13082  ORF Transcript_3299/g.13082 Transcript_3299/m.13082 type:complete len:421 (-) Transcript_3299:709-1971(-)
MSSSSAISRGRAVPIPATSSSNASSIRLRRARALSGVVLPSSERSRRGSLARFRFPSSRSNSSPATCAKASDGDDAKPKKAAPKKKKTAAKKKKVDEAAVEVEPTVDGDPAVVEPAAELTEEKKKKLAERSIDSALAEHEDDWNDARASREPNASSDDATASSSARPEVSGEEEDEEEAEVDAVKSRLLDSFYGTNRGLSASSKTRAEVNELISRLEAMNPTPSPSYELAALSGKWRLVYTSNSEVMFLLAAENLPGLNVGDITQTIDGVGGRVENRVAFSAPMLESSVSANASFEVRSPKRLQVKFDEAGVETPTIVADVFQYMSLPMTVDVMGQSIDTAPLADLMQPFQSGLTDALNGVKSAVSGLPSLKVPLPESASPGSEAWLLTTYLDGDLRIARGDGGSVFVLTKVNDPPKYGN